MLPALFLALALGGDGTLEPRLEERLASVEQDAHVRALVLMGERYDSRELQTRAHVLRRRARAGFVREELRAFAETSQAELSALLDEQVSRGEVSADELLWIVNARRVTGTPAALRTLASVPGVELVRHDPVLPESRLADAPAVVTGAPLPAVALLLPRVALGFGLPQATPNVVAQGATELWQRGVDGEGVLVMNVDGGTANTHPGLANQIWSNPDEVAGNGVDDDGNGKVDDVWGWDFASDDNQPYGTGHGTRSAGLVVGDGTGHGGVATGMAPGADMVVARIHGEGDALAAYQYAIELGVDCITSSYSFKFPDSPDYHAFRAATEVELAAGIPHANSIGNQGESTVTYPIPYNISTPGNCPAPWMEPGTPGAPAAGNTSVLACGGVMLQSGELYTPGGRGPAAWEDLLGTDPFYPHLQEPTYWDYPWSGGTAEGLLKPDLVAYTGVTTTNGSMSYSSFSGTSASTPQLGGALCLLIDANENVLPRHLAQALQVTAVDLGPPGKDNDFGAGHLQAYAAAKRLFGAVVAYPNEPDLGAAVELEISGPSGAPWVLLVGFAHGATPTTGDPALVIDLAPPLYAPLQGVHGGPDAPQTVTVKMPVLDVFQGFEIHLQLVTDDTAGATGEWLTSVVETIRIR